MPFRLIAILALLALLVLPGCKRGPTELEGAASEPATAVRQLAGHLHRNDLVGFARDALPPAQLALMETAWAEDRTRWPLAELPLADQLLPLLQALSAPGSEQALQRSFERQLAGQDRDLRAAANSLTVFGTRYVQEQGHFSEDERHHYPQIIQALGEWARQAPLGDRTLAKATIASLCAAAREVGMSNDEELAAAGMLPTLQKMGPFLAAFKHNTTRYGLDLDRTLAEVRTGLVEQKGDTATVRIHYPLAEQEIDSLVHLRRIDGRWYLASYLAEVEKAQARAVAVGTTDQNPAEVPTQEK